MSAATEQPFLLVADAIVPMDPAREPVVRNAGVVILGDQIVALAEVGDIRREFGELPTQALRGVMLPGLVNSHTHLELSYLHAEKLAATHFTQWVKNLFASYPAADQLEGIVRKAALAGARQSLLVGVTSVGDISRNSGITRSELARSDAGGAPMLRVTSFGEIVGLGKRRERLESLLTAAGDRSHEARHLRTGLSPHAPYTVEGPSLRRIVDYAVKRELPLAMHFAELAEEGDFLRDLSGPLGRDWDLMVKMDILDDLIPLHAGGPIRWAAEYGLLAASHTIPVLLAHVNYALDDDLGILAGSKASVVYCPRTHAYFGHRGHRYREMLERGINVALGTDSLASNPDLNVLREAQLLVRRDELDARTALEMITCRGARALGVRAGTICAGACADLILMPVKPDGDPVEEIVREAPAPAAIWLDGARVL